MAQGQRDRDATAPALSGREHQLAAVARFLEITRAGVTGLVLQGPAGIGKTSVWDAALGAAEDCGRRVLRARCAPQESGFGFLGLADLFQDVEPELLHGLPSRRREALESAVLLRQSDSPVDERAVFAGALDAVRRLSDGTGLVIGIDDWRWLDSATAATLAYAARRLRTVSVRFLLTERTPPPANEAHLLQKVLDPEPLMLDPLGSAAIDQLLHATLAGGHSRAQLRRVCALAAGNPMIALELGRAISRRDGSGLGSSLPLTERLRALVTEGINALSPGVRRALLAVALSPHTTVAELTAFLDEDAVEEAMRREVLALDGGRVRAVHPLFGEVVKERSRASERRELHAAMASTSGDAERRAFHLANAASGPDARLADEVMRAAEHAVRRAAVASAVELGARALALTPDDDPARERRLVGVADLMVRAGQLKRAADLLRPAVPRMSPGPNRGHAKFLLADAADVNAEEGLAQALNDVPDPSVLRARILLELTSALAKGRCVRLADAATMAAEALATARAQGDAATAVEASAETAWLAGMRGLPIEETRPHAGEVHTAASLRHGAERAAAVALMWSGRLDAARPALHSLLARADDRGEGEAYFVFRLHLCELELRAGRWDAVGARLEEWAHEEGEPVGHSAALLRCRALLAAGRGDAERAATVAREALAAAQIIRNAWHRLESLRALGLARLLSGDLVTACDSLRCVWEHTRRAGIENPGVFPAAADLAEALVLAGSPREAAGVAEELARVAAAQDHPWGRAAGACSRGHVALAELDDLTAVSRFAEAAERFAALGFPFDQARSLTSLGVAQRRLRRRREARASLQEAVGILQTLGSPGWAARAQLELHRLGGRVSSDSSLTPTEQRVADLVAQGLANKQVAAALVVTIGTVEAHLTRIYAKLGVHSRTELVRTLKPGAQMTS